MRSLWKGELPDPPKRGPTMREQLQEVASRHDVKVEDIIGRSHKRHIALARLDAYATLWKPGVPGRSSTKVGEFLGGRDHTTVVTGAHRWRALLEQRAAAE